MEIDKKKQVNIIAGRPLVFVAVKTIENISAKCHYKLKKLINLSVIVGQELLHAIKITLSCRIDKYSRRSLELLIQYEN